MPKEKINVCVFSSKNIPTGNQSVELQGALIFLIQQLQDG